jgi:hypothetical protein
MFLKRSKFLDIRTEFVNIELDLVDFFKFTMDGADTFLELGVILETRDCTIVFDFNRRFDLLRKRLSCLV